MFRVSEVTNVRTPLSEHPSSSFAGPSLPRLLYVIRICSYLLVRLHHVLLLSLFCSQFNVYGSCLVAGASVTATVNGAPSRVTPSYDKPISGPPGSLILRVTQLGLNLTHNGARVCLTLRPNNMGQGCTTFDVALVLRQI